jgi:hypothetical protein
MYHLLSDNILHRKGKIYKLGGTSITIEVAKQYLDRMERNRKQNEPCNKRAYLDARELAALVSVAEYGATPFAKQALKAIKSI